MRTARRCAMSFDIFWGRFNNAYDVRYFCLPNAPWVRAAAKCTSWWQAGLVSGDNEQMVGLASSLPEREELSRCICLHSSQMSDVRPVRPPSSSGLRPRLRRCRWLPLAAAAAEAFVLIPLCRSRRCEAREVRREAPDTQAGIPK